jgi:hypothetical protein
MATLRPDSIISEYSFTEQEAIQARLLNPLQKMWFQTKYALYFKEKASALIPESGNMDRSFFLQQGNLQGKLDMLQELFEDCLQASKELTNPQKTGSSEEVSASLVEIQQIEQRAASQVHEVNS